MSKASLSWWGASSLLQYRSPNLTEQMSSKPSGLERFYAFKAGKVSGFVAESRSILYLNGVLQLSTVCNTSDDW